MSKKKISITIEGNETKIKASDMTLEELRKFFLSPELSKAMVDGNEEEEDYLRDDEYDDDEYDEGDETDENYRLRYMDSVMKKSLDIVEDVGYSTTAKIVTFDYIGMRNYGIEVNRLVNGVTRLAEYTLEIDESGNRAIANEGNGTLIVLCPMFTKPVTEKIALDNYCYTGAVVSCQPGEDTIKGINALVEILKTMI